MRRADRNQRAANGANREPGYVGERTLAVGGIGQDSDDDPLDQRVE